MSVLLVCVMAIQMICISGITVLAGEETPIVPIEDPKVNISAINLILDGDIGLLYHVVIPEEYRDGYVTLSCKNDTEKINITGYTQTDKNLRYVFTKHLSAVELSEQVLIAVYDKNDVLLAASSNSAKDYADRLLQRPGTTAAEKKVAETLINYAHYAQLLCAEANGWVIGKDYAETPAFYAPTADASVFSKYNIRWSSASKDFDRLSMSLLLDYNTSILLYIPTENKPTVKVNGQTVEATPSPHLANTYVVEIAGINALHLADEYAVTINDVIITFSAFSYCKLEIHRSQNQDAINAMKALYEFYDATNQYLHPLPLR